MELDFEPATMFWVVVIYIMFVFGLWFIRLGEGGLDTKTRILTTIFALPIIYFITIWQKNK